MKTVIKWLAATLIFLAIAAIIGSVEVFLEKQFPNP